MRRPGGRAHRLALNRPSMIERAFLLRCLGNNVLEHLPNGKDEGKNARAAVYCKEVLRTPH